MYMNCCHENVHGETFPTFFVKISIKFLIQSWGILPSEPGMVSGQFTALNPPILLCWIISLIYTTYVSMHFRDKKQENELLEMEKESKALSFIVKGIDIKPVFQFLTDEGLLPNYTFPESGVILRSLIIKNSQTRDRENDPHIIPYEYQRPAHTALTEFAPDNVFYAGGRKVQIDQVDLNNA